MGCEDALSMHVTTHPTRIVGRSDPGEDAVEWLHAGLWLDVVIAEWSVRRTGHVHLVAQDRDLSAWHRVDIASHPMRADPDMPRPAADALRDVMAALESWLTSWPLEMHRHLDLGLVSELGESRVEFQRRVMGLVRPELQRRVSALDEAAAGRWPWQRRAVENDRARRRDRLAADLGQLGNGIQTRAVDSVADFVRRAEIGVLVCARDVDLSMGRGRTRPGG